MNERHVRRRWRIFPTRWCACGLRWPCVDRELQRLRERAPHQFRMDLWNGPTTQLPIHLNRGRPDA
jgi:hypothetical protein